MTQLIVALDSDDADRVLNMAMRLYTESGVSWIKIGPRTLLNPAEAKAAGADFIVVGRPILNAPDPVAAVRAIMEEIA